MIALFSWARALNLTLSTAPLVESAFTSWASANISVRLLRIVEAEFATIPAIFEASVTFFAPWRSMVESLLMRPVSAAAIISLPDLCGITGVGCGIPSSNRLRLPLFKNE